MGTEVIKLNQANFHNICRICYQDKNLNNLFQSKFQDMSFATLLELYEPQKVSENDGLPAHACIDCLKSLLKLNAFLDQYRVASQALRSVQRYLFSDKSRSNRLVQQSSSRKERKKCMQINYTKIPNSMMLLEKCSFISTLSQLPQTVGINYGSPKVQNGSDNKIKMEKLHIQDFMSKNDSGTNLIIVKADSPTCTKDINYTYSDESCDREIDKSETRFKNSTKFSNSAQKLYNCDDCEETFPTYSALTCHGKSMHPLLKFTCNICKKIFTKKSKLEAHIYGSHRFRDCNKCGEKLKLCSFNSHMKRHQDGYVPKTPPRKRKLCTICGESIGYHFTEHMLSHKNPKPFQCKVCPFRTQFRTSLARHYLRHKEKQFLCNACGKEFTRKEYLTKHLLRHQVLPEALPCLMCPDTFLTHFEFRKHLLSHDIYRIHSASGKPRRSRGSAKSKVDNAGDGDNVTVQRRALTKRNQNISRVCEECSKTCNNWLSYVYHMRSKHNIDKRRCDICGERIRGHMSVHMKIHIGSAIHRCEPCAKVFNSRAHLRRHVMLIHENKRDHKCPYCDRGFNMRENLAEHMRVHTGETIKCDYCEKTFKQGSTRYKHLREVHNIRLGTSRKKKINLEDHDIRDDKLKEEK